MVEHVCEKDRTDLMEGRRDMEGMSMLQWLYKCVFEQHFHSDRRRFAVALRVSEKTLDSVYDPKRAAEATLLFEQIALYCAQNDISIDEILRSYPYADRS